MLFDKGVTYIYTMALANECGFPEGCGITQSDGSYHQSYLKIISVVHYNKNIHVHGIQMAKKYTHLVDILSPGQRYGSWQLHDNRKAHT